MYHSSAILQIKDTMEMDASDEQKVNMTIAILQNFNYVRTSIKDFLTQEKSDIYKKEINFLTEFGLPDEILETSYGFLSRLDWQKEEIKRIGNCSIYKRSDGMTAIIKGVKYGKIF